MDRSRDIYTVHVEHASSIFSTVILKWHFGVGTGVPTTPTVIANSPDILAPHMTKAKLFRLPGTTSGTTDKVLSYIAWEYLGFGGNYLQTYNLTTGANHAYIVPVPSGSVVRKQQISGFEYLPSPKNRFCFAYVDYSNFDPSAASLGLVGGLGYAEPGTGSTPTTITPISSPIEYCYSDLELSKHGDMFLVHQDLVTADATLAYLPAASLTTSFTSATPTLCSTSCASVTKPISYNNFHNRFADHYATTWYLGSQIRDEDYSGTSNIVGIYTVSVSTTWTPSSNPVASATGISTSAISMEGIVIKPGVSLTIQNMTINMKENSYIDVLAGSTSTGGRLTLNNTLLTAFKPPCSTDPAMPMWGGIRVWGSSAKSQLPLTTSVQGYLRMYNNSEIRYAKTAVYAGQPELIIPPYFGMGGYLFAAMPAGGGIVQVLDCRFYNNAHSVVFMPYRNFNPPSPAIEMPNSSYIFGTSFLSDDPATVLYANHIEIGGVGVKGIAIRGCDFRNAMGYGRNTFGIYGQNMGFIVDDYTPLVSPVPVHNRFSNFDNAIFEVNTSPNYTAAIRNSIFTDNVSGVNLRGTTAAAVTGNTFNIPEGPLSYPVWPPVAAMAAETHGLILYSSTAFSVYSNKFQLSSPTHIPVFGGFSSTNGIFAWNTGGSENIISNNTFMGLGNANIANYRNRDGNNYGLWYRCNKNSYNKYDIVSRGSNPDIATGDGIKNHQGLQAPAGGKPAGNTFSVSCSDFNLYNLSSECAPISYMMSASPAPLMVPGIPCVTAANYDASITPEIASNTQTCGLPGPGGDYPGPLGGKGVIWLSQNFDHAEQLIAKLNNVTFYLTDSGGITHRDSLYYWVRQLQTPVGDRMLAGLLLEDGYTDSAIHQYDSIALKYNLDERESKELTTWGRQLFSIQAKLQRNVNVVRELAITEADSATVDSTIRSLPRYLDSATVDTLVSIFANSKYWARIGAENIMLIYDTTLFDSVLAIMPDTFLYPVVPDKAAVVSAPKGALAITEISQGPSLGCQYIEMIATHCGSNQQPYVDVSGWIIDDNSGNFNSSCDADYGSTPGHYRLAAGNPVWQHVPIGSRIVLYNQDANCYNLPDTFKVDTFNSIYWVPVAAQYSQNEKVLERYYNSNNQSTCSYCSDEGSTDYTSAFGWDQTLALAPVKDAVQVRCPGCTANISAPAFYHGIGYGPNGQSGMLVKQPGSNSLGAPIAFNNNRTYMKYMFSGSTVADLSNSQFWVVDSADTAGVRPPTLGFVSSALMDAIAYHTENFPCCAVPKQRNQDSAEHQTPGAQNTGSGNVRVFPNPANLMLNFEFPVSSEVTIRVTDVTGRLMSEQTVHNVGKAGLNVKNYPLGLYLYQVTSNGKTTSGKVVIGD